MDTFPAYFVHTHSSTWKTCHSFLRQKVKFCKLLQISSSRRIHLKPRASPCCREALEMLWDKSSGLRQCEPKSPESNAGSYANSLPLAVFNLPSRFTLDLHKIGSNPSPFFRRRVVYKLLKHGNGMACLKAGTPGPAHSSTGLSKHSHSASRASLGAAETLSPNVIRIYLT